MSLGIQHVNASDPDIHEPKGISTAAADTVYIANGTGSGAWSKVNFSLTFTIEDASPAGPTSYWVVVPILSNLVAAYAVVNDAFSIDQTIDFEIGGTPVTDGTIDLESTGSAAGNIYSSIPSADNTISAGAALEIINAGGSASPFMVTLTLVFSPV